MPLTPAQLLDWKRQQRPLVALTAWDTAIATVLDEAGVEIILVGDSLGMVALGYATTLPVTLEMMIHHAAAVKRGVKRALVICDLPFLSYQESPAQALHSAGRILKETGAQAVKLEGGHPRMVETVSRLTEIGIPVMGHVGLTPQSVHQLGYRQQGQDPITADTIHKQAIALEKAGVFALVLEHIPAALATEITQGLTIPTIGIGAGSGCDGQVLVTADLLGLTVKQPPFAPAYLNLRQIITETVQRYSEEVRQGKF
ncbi:MAG: 3-methyl-2-oxobutanoate hydroxymethyltransferase [Synechocystis sp.]